MTDEDRFRLLHGPYRTPVFRYGDTVFCDARGEMIVCGLSAGPIPWPVGKRRDRVRGRSIILYAGLADAVRQESALAVARWWGVGHSTVAGWRKALGVGADNEGTRRLRHDYALELPAAAARAKAVGKNGDPARCEKIGDALRGRARPRHVVRAVAEAHRGTKASDETRRKMSEARRRGTRPPEGGPPVGRGGGPARRGTARGGGGPADRAVAVGGLYAAE